MKKPKDIIDIELKWNNILPLFGYFAMTLFGKMWIKNSSKPTWERYIREGKTVFVTNHEMIHVKQAVSTNNSWWKFYILYVWYWFKAIFRGFKFAYKMNPFELEAYANENDLNYTAMHTHGATRWKEYKTISVKQRKRYWDDYKAKSRTGYMTFSRYIQEYIDPTLNFKEYTS